MNKRYTVGIVGLGPAGIGAALQISRSGLDCVAFEKDEIGGLLRSANFVENLPCIKAITGMEACEAFTEQLKGTKVKIVRKEATGIRYTDDLFKLRADKDWYSFKYLVYAAGTKPIIPKRYSEIAVDITSLLECENMNIAIIGGGDAAYDNALNLAKRNNVVTIIMRGVAPRALPLLIKRAEANPRIEILLEAPLKEFSISYNSVIIDGRAYDAAICAAGREPNTDLLAGANLLTRSEKVFVIGDAANGIYRQASIAFADGVRAAMVILDKEKHAKINP